MTQVCIRLYTKHVSFHSIRMIRSIPPSVPSYQTLPSVQPHVFLAFQNLIFRLLSSCYPKSIYIISPETHFLAFGMPNLPNYVLLTRQVRWRREKSMSPTQVAS
ncbi:hypothetical protein HanIR_Chr13g0635461 [Helianthus annuus]|nr:hypothetical protein HanIR_Chr13g0635461 [Helianthus annuus]